MKRWAVLVVFVYFLILVALTSPMLLAAFYPQMKAHDSLGVFSEWMYWAGLGVMIVGQAVMLLIPVDVAMQRPTTRRSVLWPLLASGLMVGVLGAGAGASILEFIRRDKALNLVGKGVPLLAVIVPVWAVWSIVFYRTGRGAAAMDVITRQCRYLLRGSVLELLVAIPTHIVARARQYCCAGLLTFLGIAFGVSVMLFSFGPSVFFLFVQRWKRLQPQPGREAD
ncbi:MAG: hypothetical protein LAO04_07650 [Acidobacteriia bacterium]|nr:hypothetical protein [Terriglobia bacterium]